MRQLVTFILAVGLIPAFAQKTDITPEFSIPRSIIKLAPLQFFSNTLELGVEAFNKDFSRSFEGNIGFRSGASDFEEGRGMSLELGYRKYVSPMKIRERKQRQFYQGIYYNIAIKGGYFEGRYDQYSWYDPNTGSYYPSTLKEDIRYISPSFSLGLQKTLWQIIFLDVFVGGGIRFSEIKQSGATTPDYYYYSDGLFSPGYDGIFPKVGARIGVGL